MASYIVCNSCNSHVEIWNHCRVCDNFDLCMSCHKNYQHPHSMFVESKNSSSPNDQVSGEIQEFSKAQRYLYHKALLHVYECRGCISVCNFMQKVFQHVMSCQVGYTCPVYSFYANVCLFHAHMCSTTRCPVFLCSNMKEFIRKEQLLHPSLTRTIARSQG